MTKGHKGIRLHTSEHITQPVLRMAETLTAIQTINADYDVVAEAEAILAEAALVAA